MPEQPEDNMPALGGALATTPPLHRYLPAWLRQDESWAQLRKNLGGAAVFEEPVIVNPYSQLQARLLAYLDQLLETERFLRAASQDLCKLWTETRHPHVSALDQLTRSCWVAPKRIEGSRQEELCANINQLSNTLISYAKEVRMNPQQLWGGSYLFSSQISAASYKIRSWDHMLPKPTDPVADILRELGAPGLPEIFSQDHHSVLATFPTILVLMWKDLLKRQETGQFIG